nr:hypothetical protein [Micromonospora okii]
MRAHRTDIVSLGFGLFFVALAAWWLLAQLLGLALPPVGWFLAGGLILIGVLGLAGALRSGRGHRTARAEDPAPTGTENPGPAAEPSAGPGPLPAGQPSADEPVSGAGPHPAREPSADEPVTGAGPLPADEWPTTAVAADRPEAVEDRPVSGAQAPRWSPADPLDEEPTVPLTDTGVPPPGEREGRSG